MASERQQTVLAYKLRLHPSRVKGEMLALLCAHFAREHARALPRVLERWWANGKPSMKGLSTKGDGHFVERVVRRAAQDLERTWKSCRATGSEVVLPTLRAEMMDNVRAQAPRCARRFQVWLLVQGCDSENPLYLPAHFHRAINRALALPGARLAKNATIFRKNGKWYATVYVHVPFAEPYAPRGFIGADVGVLLCQIAGVPVVLVPPAYTSQTHARCGSRESTVRHGELLWCAACRALEDADVNAAKQISAMARENIRTRRTKLALRDLSSGGLS
jgi:hypothetical protein